MKSCLVVDDSRVVRKVARRKGLQVQAAMSHSDQIDEQYRRLFGVDPDFIAANQRHGNFF